MTVELGDKAKDQITEFEGICVGKVQYISGCDQVLLTPKSKDGEHKDAHWFDIDRVTVTEAAVFPVSLHAEVVHPGADRPAPKK